MHSKKAWGGHSMTAPLRRVLVCKPDAAGWAEPAQAARWKELHYLRPPDPRLAEAQHRSLRQTLESEGIELLPLPSRDDLTPDAVYVHDASLPTDGGIVLLRMGKPCRQAEPARHGRFYREQGIPILGAIEQPGVAEGGDLVWLDSQTLLAGRGFRTNDAGIAQLRDLLKPLGVRVIPSPLPYGSGPDGCLHLMSLLSVLDEDTMLVDRPWLAVETMELLRDLRWRLLDIDPAERDSLACNVLALGKGALLALQENSRTNRRLQKAGYRVLTFPGSEIALNGGGGPTCLTRPLRRGSSRREEARKAGSHRGP